MVALIDGVPRTLNLRDALQAYVNHQIDVVTRRSEYRLGQARDRAHIVEGLVRALDLIDDIIALIRGSEDRASALTDLQLEPLSFSERQANHILAINISNKRNLFMYCKVSVLFM
jgi:DNA gyrase subunit A